MGRRRSQASAESLRYSNRPAGCSWRRHTAKTNGHRPERVRPRNSLSWWQATPRGPFMAWERSTNRCGMRLRPIGSDCPWAPRGPSAFVYAETGKSCSVQGGPLSFFPPAHSRHRAAQRLVFLSPDTFDSRVLGGQDTCAGALHGHQLVRRVIWRDLPVPEAGGTLGRLHDSTKPKPKHRDG
jgi:hypothetical protein